MNQVFKALCASLYLSIRWSYGLLSWPPISLYPKHFKEVLYL